MTMASILHIPIDVFVVFFSVLILFRLFVFMGAFFSLLRFQNASTYL